MNEHLNVYGFACEIKFSNFYLQNDNPFVQYISLFWPKHLFVTKSDTKSDSNISSRILLSAHKTITLKVL